MADPLADRLHGAHPQLEGPFATNLPGRHEAARFQNLREATRAAMRLPSTLRAYALPAES